MPKKSPLAITALNLLIKQVLKNNIDANQIPKYRDFFQNSLVKLMDNWDTAFKQLELNEKSFVMALKIGYFPEIIVFESGNITLSTKYKETIYADGIEIQHANLASGPQEIDITPKKSYSFYCSLFTRFTPFKLNDLCTALNQETSTDINPTLYIFKEGGRFTIQSSLPEEKNSLLCA